MLANQIMGRGVYTGQIIRKGIIIDEFEYSNLVVNQGLNYLLGSALAGGSQITTWYIGLFSGNYTVLSTDTASSIASNSTEVTAYAAEQQHDPFRREHVQLELAGVLHLQRLGHSLRRVPSLHGDDQRHGRHALLGRAVRRLQGSCLG
jgi:hypothetical protein